MKKLVSIRVSERTDELLKKLIEKTGDTQTNVIAMAIEKLATELLK